MTKQDEPVSWDDKTPPFPLSDLGAEMWARWAEDAINTGQLNDDTLAGFSALCEALADCETFRRAIAKDGLVIVSESGASKAHPAAHALESAKRTALALMKEYSLTGKTHHDLMRRGR